MQRPTSCLLLVFLTFFIDATAFAPDALAVPAFNRQTKLNCGLCHAPPPQLTPFGRRFLLSGFQYSSKKPKQPPLSGLLHTNYVSIDKTPAPESKEPGTGGDVELELASVIASGPLTRSIGYYVSADYDGIDNDAMLGTLDIRRVGNTLLLDKDLLYGFAVNNDPGLQDPWNTSLRRVWPYFASSLEPQAVGRPVLDGVLSRQVVGLGAYGFHEDSLYLEATAYVPISEDLQDSIGVFEDEDRQLDNTAIYLRLARERRLTGGSFTLGATYFDGDLEGPFDGPVDSYRDIAVNAMYQRALPKADITFTANALRETIDTSESRAAGQAESGSNHLNRYRVAFAYQYKKEFGGGLGYTRTTGSSDALYFGIADGEPDTGQWRFDLYWNALFGRVPKSYPWVRTRIGLQYLHFTSFNGNSDNYDGFGRDASDNDTFSLYWVLVF